MARDYYETLGVDRGADDATIKKAFRQLARELHPDVNAHDPDAEEKFKEAAAAYEVLSDPERRRLYDAYGEEGLRGRGYAPDMDAFGSVSDLFSAFFGQGGFEAAFGGGGGRRGRGGAMQGGDVVAAASIDLADSARGIEVEVAYEAAALCSHVPRQRRRAGHADRRRARPATARASTSAWRARRSASSCARRCATSAAATAGARRRRAASATARGWCAEQRRVAVDIPPGIADGQRIRLTRPRPRGPERRAAPATSTWSCGCARTSASCATART